MKLTKEELQILINIVANVNVPVSQSQQFIDLMNKMSLMIEGLNKEPVKEEKK